jgi:hypothetical protein
MNELQAQEYIDTYEEALDATPPEVRDFLLGDAFNGIIQGFKKKFSLTQDQTEIVSEIMHDSVLGLSKEEDAIQKMTDVGITDEIQDKILQLGYALIIAPSIQEAQNATEEAEEIKQQPPLQVTANIQNRLKASPPASSTPMREYFSSSQQPASVPAPQIPKKDAFSDPYHEPIE